MSKEASKTSLKSAKEATSKEEIHDGGEPKRTTANISTFTSESVQMTRIGRVKVPDIRDLLNMEQLEMLKDKFDVALDNIMTRAEFRESLREISGMDFDDEDFNIFFLKMNEKCDGLVTWDEYISCLLLSYKTKDMIVNIYEPRFIWMPISKRPKLLKSRHPHVITSLCFSANIDRGCVGFPLQGNYFTVSSEGVVNRWTLEMEFIKSNLADCTEKKEKIPIECRVIESLPDVNILAIATSNQEIHFYDTAGDGLTAKIIITQLDSNVTTMYFYSKTLLNLYRTFRHDVEPSPSSGDDVMCSLLVGDVEGNIFMLNFSSFNYGPFQRKMGTMLSKYTYKSISKGKWVGMSVFELNNHHLGPVRQVYYHYGLNSILSCCSTPKKSMQIYKHNDKSTKVYYGEEPITCFAVDDLMQTLVGGTVSGYLYLWNIFVTNKRTAAFKAHNHTILTVILQNKSSRIYSLDANKIIKIWNVKNLDCLQTFNSVPDSLGGHLLPSVHYNPGIRLLVMACHQILLLECDRKPSELHIHGVTHLKPVSVVLYNELFKNVVTCGCDSIIICWDLKTGVKQMVMKNAHTETMNDEEVPIHITAAVFHTNYHLLLTGAGNGTIKMWNFNTGFCLKTMSIGQNNEVTYLLWLNNRILVGSWNSCMSEFSDSSLNLGAKPKLWDKKHLDHISSADHRQGLVMVSVSYAGDLVLWNMDTISAKRQYLLRNPPVRIDIGFGVKSRHKIQSDKDKDTLQMIQPMTAQCVIFLRTRPINAQTGNFLVSLGDGNIQVWSEHPAGGFLESFVGVHTVGDYVTVMITDEDNQFLITGTACGYIKIWLLTNYHTSEQVHICMPKLRLQFPFMWNDRLEGRVKKLCKKQPVPLMMSSYRAHIKAISSIVYIPEHDYILSGSGDGSVRIWNLSGQYLNTLGSFLMPWQLEPKMPPDVFKVASFTTLKVLNNGNVSKYVPNFGEKRTYITPSETTLLEKLTLEDKVPTSEFLRKICKLPEHPPAVPKLVLDDSMPKIPVYTYLKTPIVGQLPLFAGIPSKMLEIQRRKIAQGGTKERKGIHFAT